MIRKLTVILIAGVICVLGVTSVWAAKYSEAPMLRVKVATGELPPVGERLPEEPMVVPVVEKIGQYGGTGRLQSLIVNTWGDGQYIFAWPTMIRITPDGRDRAPNIAKSWEFSKDKETITLYLRKGMKWSDGVPFTADDIMFWYENVLLNDELTPVKSTVWMPGGELMTMEKIDDYTVRLHFSSPYPRIMTWLGHYAGMEGMFFIPKHIAKQFHPRYVPIEKLEEMAKEKGFEYWYELFAQKAVGGLWGLASRDPGFPTLFPYVLKESTLDYMLLERNPYYWKVDPDGNQLPYIDRYIITFVGDPEVANARMISGEVDFAAFQTKLANASLYQANTEKGNYRLLFWERAYGASVFFQPNQTYKEDPVLGHLFSDVRFRRALSLGIDRGEINDVLYFGLGVPRQLTVLPESKYYEEEFARAYAEYNPAEANAILDEIGLKWDENHEYRLRPDGTGKRLSIILEYAEGDIPRTPLLELVREQWKTIGIDISLKLLSWDLAWQRVPANVVQMTVWEADSCLDVLFEVSPYWCAATYSGGSFGWAPLWSLWYLTDGEKGEEPPEEIKKNLERFKKIQITVDEEEGIRLGKEILRSQAENLWTIGTVGKVPVPVIVSKNLRNVPETALMAWDVYAGLVLDGDQFFLMQE